VKNRVTSTVNGDPFRVIRDREFSFVWHALRFGIAYRNLTDVTHDVFAAVYRSLHTFDGTRPFRSWLFSVTMRMWASFMYRRAYRVAVDSLAARGESRPATTA
jgi:DNA-directed RNA polymerase specialized sigma24 family protein